MQALISHKACYLAGFTWSSCLRRPVFCRYEIARQHSCILCVCVWDSLLFVRSGLVVGWRLGWAWLGWVEFGRLVAWLADVLVGPLVG